MRRKVTKTYDNYNYDRENETIEKLYRKQQREYKMLISKAKINETVADEDAMTKKIKNLTVKVTALKLPCGKYTEIGKETCEEMMSLSLMR